MPTIPVLVEFVMHVGCMNTPGLEYDLHMSRIFLISCSKSKRDSCAKAEQLYTSPLFRKSLLFAISQNNSAYFIVSAKHGLLAPDAVVEPYDVTLKKMTAAARSSWGKSVAAKLSQIVKIGDSIVFLSGAAYSKPIIQHLRGQGILFQSPLQTKSLGQRLSFLALQNDERRLFELHGRYLTFIRNLRSAQQGGVRLGDASGRLGWPARGVYFFIEDSECSENDLKFRVSRIGTHAVSRGSRTTLWDRLSTHRGVNSGLGSHRSSIFRLHVGRALISRGEHPPVKSWGVGQSASRELREQEASLERLVSMTIGRMRVLWLENSR